MKTPYLDKEIELLEGYKDKKEASFYQLRKLAEYREIKQLILHGVVNSKITALVTYWKWQESEHVMIDDSKNKTSEIIEVENLTDINQMFTNIIDVKILK